MSILFSFPKRITDSCRVSILLCCLVVVAEIAVAQQEVTKRANAAVTGSNLAAVEKVSQGKVTGRFRQIDNSKAWREEIAIDAERRDWKEVMRDEWSVYLQDGKAMIQIDLHTKEIYYSEDGLKTKKRLYTVQDPRAADRKAKRAATPKSSQDPVPAAPPKPLTQQQASANVAVTGSNLAAVEKVSQGKVIGRFRQIDNDKAWREVTAIDAGHRDWKEVMRDEWSVYLQDGKAMIQIDLHTKEIYYSEDGLKTKTRLYTVQNPRAGDRKAKRAATPKSSQDPVPAAPPAR